MLDDTIAAISTPLGVSGIGIVRISGSEARDIVYKVFVDKKGNQISELKDHILHYGFIIDYKTKQKIDEVLVAYMKGPHSFTAEDVIEINCHGGIISTKKVLETVLTAGARIAEPGEFSKRAFLNGRIDLAQAESIIDTINAKTTDSLKIAIKQLEGHLSNRIKDINHQLMELIAFIEAGIDFPEDDIEELSLQEISKRAKEILSKLEYLLNTADTGKIYREGINTVILGKPNVGKSSLLNALIRETRAIVTDVPGTTRDFIEEIINIKGIPLKIVDTAGIRDTADEVEKIGVEKAKEITKKADLILFVIDAAQGLTEEDKKALKLITGKKAIVIINKIDIARLSKEDLIDYIEDLPIVELSAKEEMGIEKLENQIIDLVLKGQVQNSEDALVSNIRHQNALERAKNHIEEVIKTIDSGMPTDCMAIDLKGAWECLGEISGESLDEDIINKIFSEFCIGK